MLPPTYNTSIPRRPANRYHGGCPITMYIYIYIHNSSLRKHVRTIKPTLCKRYKMSTVQRRVRYIVVVPFSLAS